MSDTLPAVSRRTAALRMLIVFGLASALGVLASWLLIGRDNPGPSGPVWVSSGALLGLGAAASALVVRRLRRLLGVWTSVAAVGLVLSLMLALTVVVTGGSLSEASELGGVGALFAALLMLIAGPFMALRGGVRLLGRLRSGTLRGRQEVERDAAAPKLTKRTNLNNHRSGKRR